MRLVATPEQRHREKKGIVSEHFMRQTINSAMFEAVSVETEASAAQKQIQKRFLIHSAYHCQSLALLVPRVKRGVNTQTLSQTQFRAHSFNCECATHAHTNTIHSLLIVMACKKLERLLTSRPALAWYVTACSRACQAASET